MPADGDKWHLDAVVLTIAGVKHWLGRAVDQSRTVLDIPVQSQRDTQAAEATVPGASCRGHRQAGELRNGQA